MAEGDILWRRPTPSTDRADAHPDPYEGPPKQAADTLPTQAESPAPRDLPAVDHDAVDADERRAARLTYLVGAAALMTLIVVAIWRIL